MTLYNSNLTFYCLLEVEIHPPLVLVAGISSRIGCTSDEFIPTQPMRFTAATCTRISSLQFDIVRVDIVEDEVSSLMFRDGT